MLNLRDGSICCKSNNIMKTYAMNFNKCLMMNIYFSNQQVCLDLPPSAIMQCCHGHLMCIGCYHHLLGDARLKDEQVCITFKICVHFLGVNNNETILPHLFTQRKPAFPFIFSGKTTFFLGPNSDFFWKHAFPF